MKENKNKEAIRAFKFFLISTSAGLIETGSFALMNELSGLTYGFCYLTALTLSILWNFTINRRYTFKSAANIPEAMFLVFLFYCVFTPVTTIGGNYLTEDVFRVSASSFLQNFGEYITLGLTMCCNLISEYLYDKYAIYKYEMDNNKLTKEEQEAARRINRSFHQKVVGIDLTVIGVVTFLYGLLLNTGYEPLIRILVADNAAKRGIIWQYVGPVLFVAGIVIITVVKNKNKNMKKEHQ